MGRGAGRLFYSGRGLIHVPQKIVFAEVDTVAHGEYDVHLSYVVHVENACSLWKGLLSPLSLLGGSKGTSSYIRDPKCVVPYASIVYM